MGTDIHLFVEVRDGAGEPWRLQPVEWKSGEHTYVGFDWRDYDVFAMLADVRNGVGFAGVVTGDGFNIIADARGLPDDMSAELRAIAAEEYNDDRAEQLKESHGAWWLGEHTHSHLTLRELLDFNWNQRTNHSGVVEAPQYRVFVEDGKPLCYSGSIQGGSVRHVDNDTMAKFADACTFVPDYRKKWDGNTIEAVTWSPELVRAMAQHGITPDNWHMLTICTRVQWSESYKESAGEFYKGFVPALAQLATGRGKDDVRIVFGFDS